MTRIRIAAGHEFDVVGPDELHAHFEKQNERFRHMVMEQVRGVKIMRLPRVNQVSAGGQLLIPSGQGGGSQLSVGPESGFVWRVSRVNVRSSGTDNATANPPTPGAAVQLWVSSDGAITGGAVLVDSVLQCGQAYYPSSRGLYLMPGEQLVAVVTASTSGNTYSLTGQAVSVPAEAMGKLV